MGGKNIVAENYAVLTSVNIHTYTSRATVFICCASLAIARLIWLVFIDVILGKKGKKEFNNAIAECLIGPVRCI